jgi:hypothetical protein
VRVLGSEKVKAGGDGLPLVTGFLFAFTLSLFHLFTFASAAGSQAQTDANATSPAHQWLHFRGSRLLTGVSAGSLPEKLTVAWTYEAGESIESSAAIADGAV